MVIPKVSNLSQVKIKAFCWKAHLTLLLTKKQLWKQPVLFNVQRSLMNLTPAVLPWIYSNLNYHHRKHVTQIYSFLSRNGSHDSKCLGACNVFGKSTRTHRILPLLSAPELIIPRKAGLFLTLTNFISNHLAYSQLYGQICRVSSSVDDVKIRQHHGAESPFSIGLGSNMKSSV